MYNMRDLETKTIRELSLFLDYFGAEETIKRFEQQVLDLKNKRLSYWFAKVEGADVRAHGKIIIEDGHPYYNYLMARIEGVDVKAHEKVVMDHGNPYYIDLFSTITATDKADEQIDNEDNHYTCRYSREEYSKFVGNDLQMLKNKVKQKS